MRLGKVQSDWKANLINVFAKSSGHKVFQFIMPRGKQHKNLPALNSSCKLGTKASSGNSLFISLSDSSFLPPSLSERGPNTKVAAENLTF